MPSARRAALLLLAFAALSFLTRAVVMRAPVVDIDESSYAVIAKAMVGGGRLYVDAADHKPPLVYLYFAAVQVLFGPRMLAVRLVTTLLVLPLTALALSAFYGHDRRGAAAGAAYLLYGSAFLAHDMLAVNAEVLLLLPACAALALLRDEGRAARPWRAAAAGGLLGVAVLVKHQAALWLPAVLWAVTRPWPRGKDHRPLGRAALLLLAAALSPLAAWAVFAMRGTARDFLYWNLTHNLKYLANPIRPSEAATLATKFALPFLATTAPLWWAAWRSRRLGEDYPRRLAWLALALSGVSSVLGLRFYPHYFIVLYPPLALLAAPFAAAALSPRPSRAGWVLAGATGALVLAWAAVNAITYARHGVEEETDPVFAAVADRLRRDPCHPGASLFVWGYAPTFYQAADLPPATRFVFLESTLVGYVPGNAGSAGGDVDAHDRILPRHWDWLMDDLERHRATYVLDTSFDGLHRWRAFRTERFPRMAGLLAREYERLDQVDAVVIYRRRGCASGAAVGRR